MKRVIGMSLFYVLATVGATSSASADASRVKETIALPASSQRFTPEQIDDPFNHPDWYPESHPSMPDIVRHGDRDSGLWACAVCHLTSGSGHPQSAALSGLSEEYLYSQLLAFKRWQRIDHTGAMFMFVMRHEDKDLKEAAHYFASLKPRASVRVVEAQEVPVTYVDKKFMRLVKEEGEVKSEPIGQRIISVPEDRLRAEARDPFAKFIAYVPAGSIARGRKIANEGTAQSPPCTACHGADMKGTKLGPFLAGQYPDYLMRQLHAFKVGTRRLGADPNEQMSLQVRYLTEDDLVAVAAYIASLPRD